MNTPLHPYAHARRTAARRGHDRPQAQRLRAWLACAFLCTTWGAQAAAPSGLPPVDAFFKPVDMRQPVLSPSGKYAAVLGMSAAGHRQLVIVDTGDVHKVNVAAGFGDGDVVDVEWVNDERLLFWVGREDATAWRQPGNNLFAVDRDGGAQRLLISGAGGRGWNTTSHIKDRTLGPDYELLRTLRDGSDDVVVDRAIFQLEDIVGEVPMRLDTRTGQTSSIGAGTYPDNTMDWAVNEQGKLLAAIWARKDRAGVLLPDGTGWRPANEFGRYAASPGSLSFVAAIGDDVYVEAGSGAPDGTSALFKLDPQTGRPAPAAIVNVKGFDFRGSLVPDLARHGAAGVHYVSDGPGTAWFTPAMRQMQAEVDAKLPGYVNRIQPAECGCSTRALVTASSDHQPPVFMLYDSATRALITLGSERPWIDPKQMADMDFARIKTRDGLDMPVYVTKPAGKGPFPAVVLVHGGPFMRGEEWGFQEEPQFLASRGYVVIEPEFRGSAGYGATLEVAGFKQWGLAMDDDLVDAARWAAGSGLVDARRVCVMGASYGGYATLMALIKDPAVFRCGVAASAVTDIALMYVESQNDLTQDSLAYSMPVQVGDPVKDAAQLEATSPLKQAARLKQPLLLAHGDSDRRVPIEQAEKLRAALLASGKTNLVWLRYGDEAHGLYDPKSRLDFYQHVEAFLAANIGEAAASAAAR